ncbi:hypothetical protein D3C71_1561980 [compost metagenome]
MQLNSERERRPTLTPLVLAFHISANVPLCLASRSPTWLWNMPGALTIRPATPLKTTGCAPSAMSAQSFWYFSSIASPRAMNATSCSGVKAAISAQRSNVRGSMSSAARKAGLSGYCQVQMSRSSMQRISAGSGLSAWKNSQARRAPDLFMSKCTTPQRQV